MGLSCEGGPLGGETDTIDEFRVPETGVFILGCLESRVTLLSQQRRAINLVDALLTQEFVGDDSRVAVIGAGAAGLTAAAALVRADSSVRVDLFEYDKELMRFQRSSERNLHPRIYDWPLKDATDPEARLPLLDWRSGAASKVTTTITDAFHEIRREADPRLKLCDDCFVEKIEPLDDRACRVKVMGHSNSKVYDAVILAIGFGDERKAEGQNFCSYWAPALVQGPLPRGSVVLISGNGDGGLVDFAVAALPNMSHTDIIELVTNHLHTGKITNALIEIDRRAWKENEEDFDIFKAYEELEIPQQLLSAVHRRLRSNTNIWLHTREPALFRRTTAIINRFTAFLIIAADKKYNAGYRQFHHRSDVSCNQSGNTWIMGDDTVVTTQMVPRFGPDKEMNFQPFAQLIKCYRKTRPPRDKSFRPAMPELTLGAQRRFGKVSELVVQRDASAEETSASSSPHVVQKVVARGWLDEKGIRFEAESLELYIRSGDGEAVRHLLQAGISPDVLLSVTPPLTLALTLLDDEPGSREKADVVRAVAAACPRGLHEAAHQALAEGSRARLFALLAAGVGIDARDSQGQSLAARAMRTDEQTASADWTGLLVRGAATPLAPMQAAWLMLWAASKSRVELLEALLDKGVPVDSRLDNEAPNEPVQEGDRSVWWTGGTALHLVMSRAEDIMSLFYPEADRYSAKALRLLLDRGASPTAVDAMKRTPLHIAARCGLVEAAELLIAAGSDLALRDEYDDTPLDCAMSLPRSEKIAELIAHKALPTATDERARLLHRAAANRDLPMLKLFLEKGFNPDATHERIPSALMALARRQDETMPRREASTSCISLLLSHRANPMIKDELGWTPLHWLASGTEPDAVELLLSAGGDPNAIGKDGRTALMNARSPEICRALLDAGASPSTRESAGYDAADVAWLDGRNEVVSLLRGENFEPRAQTRLISAVQAGDIEGVTKALDAGAPSLTKDLVGRPVLNLAAETASADLVRLLLDRGADVHGRDKEGRNALDWCLTSWRATASEISACAMELISRGSSLDCVKAPNGSSIAAAFRGRIWWQDAAMADLLLKACGASLGWDGENALMVAAERGTVQQVAAQLAAGSDPAAIDSKGRTALFYAVRSTGDAENSFAQKADALLHADADIIDASAADGSTPLFEAVTWANWDAVRWLVDKGAESKRRDAKGLTPQLIAIRIREPGLANLLVGVHEG